MKHLFSFRQISVFALLTCLVLPLTAKADEPLNFSASLEKSRVMQGEPLVLTYSLENFTRGPITVEVGPSAREWLRVSVLDDKGNPVAHRPDNHPPVVVNDQSSLSPIEFLKLHDAHKGQFVVTREFAIDRPGIYRVAVQARVTYHLGKRHSVPDLPFAGDTWGAERTFQISVVPMNRAKMRDVAEKWSDQVLTEIYPEVDDAIRALFSMPEEVALPMWAKVVAKSGGRSTIREELVRLSTPRSLELLAVIARDSTPSSETRELAINDLQLVYKLGDPKLRPHVKSLILSLGVTPISLPDPMEKVNP